MILLCTQAIYFGSPHLDVVERDRRAVARLAEVRAVRHHEIGVGDRALSQHTRRRPPWLLEEKRGAYHDKYVTRRRTASPPRTRTMTRLDEHAAAHGREPAPQHEKRAGELQRQ